MDTSFPSSSHWMRIQNRITNGVALLITAALALTFMVTMALPSAADNSNSSNQKTIVVTGFDAFGGADHNTSWEVAKQVAQNLRSQSNVVVFDQEIHTEWAKFYGELNALIKQHHPDAIISLGEKDLSSSFNVPSVELRAKNKQRGTDNAHQYYANQEVVAKGPVTLDAEAENSQALKATQDAGLKLNPSYDAGVYLCNAALYANLTMQGQGLVEHAAFIHVPHVALGDSRVNDYAAAITNFTQNLANLPASTPAASQSATPTPTATETATVVPSSTPTATATSSSTPAPTGTATAVPTSKATPTGEQPKNEEPTSTGDEDLSDVVISQRVDKVGSETTGTSQQTHPTGLNELTQSEGEVNVKTDAETSEIKGVKGTQAQTTTQKNTAANTVSNTAGGEQRVNAPKGGLLALAETGSTAMWIIIAAGVLALSGALTVGVSALRTRKKKNNTPDAVSE